MSRAARLIVAKTALMGSAGVNAVTPLATTYLAVELLPSNAGVIAVGLTVVAYSGQVANAFLVEAKLTDSATRELAEKLPYWAILAGLAGFLICVSFSENIYFWLVGLIPLGAIAETSRMQSIVTERVVRELVCSLILLLALGGIFLAGSRTVFLIGVPAAFLAVILARCHGQARRSKWVKGAKTRWVVSESLISGATQPLIAVVVLAHLGSADAVAFRMVCSVVNIFGPILVFARIRMLSSADVQERFYAIAVAVITAAGICIVQTTGLFGAVFGAAWLNVTGWMVVVACLWKLSTLMSTAPYAQLRRAGYAQQVFWIRVLSTGVYVIAGLGGVFSFGSLGVLLGYVVAEVVSWRIYVLVANRKTLVSL